MFYTYSKLQGSQTTSAMNDYDRKFYTYSKLQGSQTAFEHITPYV